jgi:hypothetical protein
MELQVDVGPQTVQDGTKPTLRGGRSGEAIVQELHGRYFEQAVRKAIYSASNQAAQAVSAALATTYTGIVLSNPFGNAFNLALLKVAYALSAAPAAIASLHLIGGFSPSTNVVHTTPITTLTNNFLGGPNPTAKVDSAATIPTPTYLWSLCNGFTAAALPSQAMPAWDFEGSILVPPGGFVAIGALTAVTGFGSIMWEEVPI